MSRHAPETESAVPDEVYEAAARSWVAAWRPGQVSIDPEWAELAARQHSRDEVFRAVVEAAYRTGRQLLVDRVRELATEQFQAGNPWPAGTQLTAQGIRDMLVLLVAEAANE